MTELFTIEEYERRFQHEMNLRENSLAPEIFEKENFTTFYTYNRKQL